MSKETHKINDLESWVKEIDKKLDNHLVHVGADISAIKEGMEWVKESLEDTKNELKRFDSRTWAILATIVIGFLASLYLK